MKKAVAWILMTLIAISLVGCSTQPCIKCDTTPTKAYKNELTNEYEYYCKDCSSECYLCGDEADKHYTGGVGIIFICNDCYEELKEYGWVG